MLACKDIFATPSIDIAVKDRKKPNGFRDFIEQNPIRVNYSTNQNRCQ